MKGELLSFVVDLWFNILEGVKDFICNMLNLDLCKCYIVFEVLKYFWICEDGVVFYKFIVNVVQFRLKQFVVMNKLKKLVICIIVEKLFEEEIVGLKEIFFEMDRDNDGVILFEEFKEGLLKVGIILKEVEIFDFMDVVDVDQDGIIDYGEFFVVMLSLNYIEFEENLFVVFQYFDKDGSGYIIMDEVFVVCYEFNMEDV